MSTAVSRSLSRTAGSPSTAARVGTFLLVLVAAASAAVLVRRMFGDVGNLGATLPGHGFTDVQAMLVGFLLTFGLVSTILGTASTAQNVGPLLGGALAVGVAVLLRGRGGDAGGSARNARVGAGGDPPAARRAEPGTARR